MIKAVLFDLDNTLYDYYSVSNYALKKVYKILSKKIHISNKNFLQILNKSKREIRKELNHSPDSHDRMIYFQRMGEKLNLDLDFVLKLYDVYYRNFLKNIKARKGAKKTFMKIKKKKIKIIIFTNEVVEIQLRKTKELGILKYVDYFVASENVGADKPNKKMFLYALKKINVKPSEVIMVGDSEEDDIFGSRNVGMKNILLSQKKVKTKADYKIKNISEVLEIVMNLNKKEEK